MNKRSRFERIAVNRTNNIIKALQLLSNCSNKNNYEYNEDDVKKIFGAIDDQLRLTKLSFSAKIKKKTPFNL